MSVRLQPDKDAFQACYGVWLDQVAGLIRGSEIGTSFGLLGPWGSGKSSACAALVWKIHGLNKAESGLSFQCVTIDTFKLRNLSKFEQDSEIYNQLSDEILLKAEVRNWGKHRKRVYEALKQISPALSIFGNLGAGDLIAKLAERAIKEVDKDTAPQDLPESPNVDRVVIFLDDLDRCDPQEAMMILGNINSHSFVNATNIIVACDPDVLAAHISSACGIPKHSGRDVLSKYLHVPIRVPMGENKEHKAVLATRLADLQCDEKLKNAVLRHHAALPIREILSAIPQANL
jgi:hypothetical protein